MMDDTCTLTLLHEYERCQYWIRVACELARDFLETAPSLPPETRAALTALIIAGDRDAAALLETTDAIRRVIVGALPAGRATAN